LLSEIEIAFVQIGERKIYFRSAFCEEKFFIFFTIDELTRALWKRSQEASSSSSVTQTSSCFDVFASSLLSIQMALTIAFVQHSIPLAAPQTLAAATSERL
jgi:hypothetical protein